MNRSDQIIDLYRYHLPSFIAFAFEEVHPDHQFQHNWHIDVLADRLESCFEGKSRRLAISMPPRMLKSFCSSVAFVAYVLGHDPSRRFIILCGSQGLASDLSSKLRGLLASQRYQSLFPHAEVKNSSVLDVRLTHGGGVSYGVCGQSQIGRGADYLIVDDPISPQQALDDPHRRQCNAWFEAEVVPRLNNKSSGALIIVMQRVHPDDLVAQVLQNRGWDCLEIPALAPTDTRFVTRYGSHTVKRGDVLFPSRESKDTLREILTQIGGHNFRAQYLQSPSSNPEWPCRTRMLFPNPNNPHPDCPGGLYDIAEETFVLKEVFGEATYLAHLVTRDVINRLNPPVVIEAPRPADDR